MKTIKGTFVDSKGKFKAIISFDEDLGIISKIEKYDDGDKGFSNFVADFTYGDDCLIFSGMGDVHIHAREDETGLNNYKEDFNSVGEAALSGGVVHVCDMPNNPKAPVNDDLYLKKEKLAEKSKVDICLYAGIGPGTEPLKKFVPYKAYMGPSVGDLFFKDKDELEASLRPYRKQWVSFHCEDPEVLDEHKAEKSHAQRRPIQAEILATKTAIEMIEKFQLKGKLCHYSAAEGLGLIREARNKGLFIEIEVTPQHLYFSQENLKQSDLPNVYFQMNPPIRGERDRLLLLQAFKNGEINFLATDHAPHTHEEKQQGTSGLTGLDTYAPFVTWLLIDEKVLPEQIAKSCCENPGEFFSRFKAHKKRGKIEIGYLADFTILNLKKPISVNPNNLKTKVKWSPFEGVTFPGSLEGLIKSGKKIK